MQTSVVAGSNARCLAFLYALKQVCNINNNYEYYRLLTAVHNMLR